MKIKLIALGCCCALLPLMLIGPGAASATARHSAPRAHSSSDPYLCLWRNSYADPKLWIRAYPSTDAKTIYSITYGGHFWGTRYADYSNGVHWVELQSGGWANASYLTLLSNGADWAYCSQ